MSLDESKIPESSGGYGVPQAGQQYARIVGLVDMGVQPQQFKGQPKTPAPQVNITFELPGDRIDVEENGTTVSKPRWISDSYKLSKDDRSGIVKLKQKVGAATIKDLIDKICIVDIIHKEKDGETKAYIKDVYPVVQMPGQAPIELPPATEYRIFDFDAPDQAVFDKLPAWLQDAIRTAHNVGDMAGPINFTTAPQVPQAAPPAPQVPQVPAVPQAAPAVPQAAPAVPQAAPAAPQAAPAVPQAAPAAPVVPPVQQAAPQVPAVPPVQTPEAQTDAAVAAGQTGRPF